MRETTESERQDAARVCRHCGGYRSEHCPNCDFCGFEVGSPCPECQDDDGDE